VITLVETGVDVQQKGCLEDGDMPKDYRIAVLDLGKTNKKIAIFTPELDLEYKESIQIGETRIDGLLSDDISETTLWALEELRRIAERCPIRVISITTFGATIALLNKKGELAFPIISYNQEPGDEKKRKFHEEFESDGIKTATPPYGQLLNAGLQLFWLKGRYPPRFAGVKDVLFLPQYIGYILTGEKAVEFTCVGCHTYLYDFEKKDWSNVAKKLGVLDKFPPEFSNPWDALGILKADICASTGLDRNCIVTVGIHDSNSSLLPYLLVERDLILASTGTWCVFMCPGADFQLSMDDLYHDTLYYLDPFGRPVRSARFKGGEEHAYYIDLIEKRFGSDPRKIRLNPDLLSDILASCDSFVIPTLTPGSGQFPRSKPRIIGEEIYRDVETAYHVLNLSLAIQSYFSIRQITGDEVRKMPIFIEGGFSDNEVYLGILSTLFPEQEVIITDIQEASALGAAICGKCAYENVNPMQIDPALIKIDRREIEKLDLDRKLLGRYINKFVEHCSSE